MIDAINPDTASDKTLIVSHLREFEMLHCIHGIIEAVFCIVYKSWLIVLQSVIMGIM